MQSAHSGHLYNNVIRNAEPYSIGKWLHWWLRIPVFRNNYLKYIQWKLWVNNLLNRYLYMAIMMVESVFERMGSARYLFFFLRGLFPIYLLVNLAFIWCFWHYAMDNTPNFLKIATYLTVWVKILMTFLLLWTDPGRMKRENKIEKYIKHNRKDLANVKAMMGNGTFPLRSNFCYISKALYTRFETYSYYFMSAIASRNAGYYYIFMLNEVIFWIVIAVWFGLNFSNFWYKSAIRFCSLTLIWLIYTYKMWFDHKKIWISLKNNMTMTERMVARK